MTSILDKIFSPLGSYRKRVVKINDFEKELSLLSDEEIKNKSLKLKEGFSGDQEYLENNLELAFALVRESSKRNLKQRHFDVQLIGGLAMSDGKIVEMATGEGKTLSATLPAYLYGISGKGVHVITVNDYLAKRDAVWMGQIYDFLGLTVSCLVHDGAYVYDSKYTNEIQSEEVADEKRDVVGGFKVI
ncbi:MAG: preprotein translocase subunit SecA, partial [Candidatus Paceibacterota bacterium]